MKIAKIKETGAEIPVREVGGGYQSYLSENIYPADDVEIIEDTPDDFGIDSDIKNLQNKITKRKNVISAAEHGIAWLEKYKHDLDAPCPKIRLSFLDYDFSVDKFECAALLQRVKYDQEQMLHLDEKFLAQLNSLAARR